MSDSNGNGSQNLPESQQSTTEIVSADDALYLRIQDIAGKLVGWYEFIVGGDPKEVEKFAKAHRWTANARLRIAPIAIHTVVPAKKKIEYEQSGAKKRLSPTELLSHGLSIEGLKELAKIEDKS